VQSEIMLLKTGKAISTYIMYQESPWFSSNFLQLPCDAITDNIFL